LGKPDSLRKHKHARTWLATARQSKRTADYKQRFKLAASTQRWAVTMTKVCIRQIMSQVPFPRWHFVSFTGPGGRESRGVVVTQVRAAIDVMKYWRDDASHGEKTEISEPHAYLSLTQLMRLAQIASAHWHKLIK
jgi:hypothetical protein